MPAAKKPAVFTPSNLPKDFPSDGVMKQHGKTYITHVGLVWLADNRGKPWSKKVHSPEIMFDDKGEPLFAHMLCTVWDDEREHTDIGDSTRRNVGGNIAPHLIRMASTRAQNRALRSFVGYAGCTADELEIGQAYEGKPDVIGFGEKMLGDGYAQDAADEHYEPDGLPPDEYMNRQMERDEQARGKANVQNIIAKGAPPLCPVCDNAMQDKCEKKAVSWDDNAVHPKSGAVGCFTWNGPLFSCTSRDDKGDYCKGAIWWASKVPVGPWWAEGGALAFVASKEGTRMKQTEVVDGIPF